MQFHGGIFPETCAVSRGIGVHARSREKGSRAARVNKPALLVSYRGLSKDNNVPIQFLSAMISSGNIITRVTGWCIEPLFQETQPTFEKILTSYRSTEPISAAAASAKP
jgi:hypothetical protein